MHEVIVNSGLDTLLIAIPSLGLLLITFLRLDQMLAAPKQRNNPGRFVRGVNADGEPIMCDPDGRPWEEPRRRKKFAQMRDCGGWR
jgi:hypothetical protein